MVPLPITMLNILTNCFFLVKRFRFTKSEKYRYNKPSETLIYGAKMITKAESRQFQLEGEIRRHKNNLSSFMLRQSLGEPGWENMITWTENSIKTLENEQKQLNH